VAPAESLLISALDQICKLGNNKSMKTAPWSFAPFKGLKEALADRHIVLREIKVDKIRNPKTDEEVFSEAMADVREIKEFREIPLTKQRAAKRIRVTKDDTMEILSQIVKGQRRITLSDTPEYIEWVHPRVRKDVARKLHQGNYAVQDYIDLHGMTVDEAEEALFLFFREAAKKRSSCVKVIHGRGLRSPRGPVLKEAVIKWLHGQFSRLVLAYSSAKARDGGLGATYIILKTK
jgi:DNA-nicking Smr family endonuclease